LSRKIAITCGDSDGIGLEVATKALLSIGPQKSLQFFLFRQKGIQENFSRALRKVFSVETFQDLAAALEFAKKRPSAQLIEIVGATPPAHWVELSAQHCLKKDFSSLVTAPLSKQTIIESGFTDIGHTEILKRVCKTKHAFMCFLGPKFNVLLATGHVPLTQVSKTLNRETLRSALHAADSVMTKMNSSLRPLGVVALNPHAGENGLLGREEGLVFKGIESTKLVSNRKVIGPLVPDVAFQPQNWKRYSMYIASYHDQGLIAFKSHHQKLGSIHVTAGLPIVRTSVDHGTAKDLFGKNKADPSSMRAAILAAIKLSPIVK
jgi:4-hydroxythreonine-4-phosphate dehydrogenase